MTIPVDLTRCVPARLVDDIDAPDVGPGCLMVTTRGGDLAGYILTCPGCGARSGLYLHPPDPGAPRWTVTAGDPRRAEGLSLAPSIHHTPARGGCGWHGYLIHGRFVTAGGG